MLQLTDDLLNSPAAQRARHAGMYAAMSELLADARRLAWWGRPLQMSVLAVSGLHILHLLAAIKPGGVSALWIPDVLYHMSAIAFVVAIDAVAAYLLSSRSIAEHAGEASAGRSVWFFWALTALLNGVFVLQYAPGMPAVMQAALPALHAIVGVLLALLIPVSLVSLEAARERAERARLQLLVNTHALQGALASYDTPDNDVDADDDTGTPAALTDTAPRVVPASVTPDALNVIITQKAKGVSFHKIGKTLGLHHEVVRRAYIAHQRMEGGA
jgi:hypothetical protein